jgi:hypothetical protein
MWWCLTKSGQPISPTSGRSKVGCIWRLSLIYFRAKWWVGLSLLCPLGRPYADFVVRQCVTNGLFTHRAQGRRKPKSGLLHHSDRGSQYASHDYRKHLSIMKMEQSTCNLKVINAPEGMSRKGNCWEWLPLGYNSPTERFFRSLKHEQLTLKNLGLKHQLN